MTIKLATLKKRATTFFFTYKEQQAFLEDFQALVEDGVNPTLAIETISQIAKGNTKLAAIAMATTASSTGSAKTAQTATMIRSDSAL